MTRYAKRKLKYSANENFNLLSYVQWDRFHHFFRNACTKSGRYDNVTLIPLVLQLGLRIGPIERKHSCQSSTKFSEEGGTSIVNHLHQQSRVT
jgi:hypothetical protein